MTDEAILMERRDDGVAVLTLNAPEKRNAIDLAMVQGLHRALDTLTEDEGLQAVVLTGAGEKAFAAGADIGQLLERKAPQALAAINSNIFTRIEEFPVPVIAAIRGWCLGGGCELAIACDLRVGGRSAKMGQPEVKLGIIPAAGGTYRLPRLIGLGLARELVYTGRILEADECARIGLLNHVVDDDEVLSRALALAQEIAQNGGLAVRMAKAAMNGLARSQAHLASPFESIAQAVLFESEDKHARMQAFLDKSKSKRAQK